MDIDVYQQCPCHSEKKIKFCCGKEIVTDLNQILAKNSAGQGLAALDQLDRVINKTGPRDCLLTIQTHILIAQGEIEKAKISNGLFLEKNPQHSTGLHHQALIRLADDDVAGAVESLQDAMDAITGNEIPLSMAAAFRMIGIGLMQEGHLVGARAHWEFARFLKNGQDRELSQMIYETFRIPDASLLFKQEFRMIKLVDPNPEAEWIKKYANVQRAIDRGQFRKALKFLKKIDANFPVQPEIVRGIAVLCMYLGYFDDVAPAWRRYSRLDGLSELQAVEAEALAQLFAGDSDVPELEIVRVSFELNAFAPALEKALSTDRMASTGEVSEDPFEEGPAPRNAFYFLDRPLVAATELSLENVSDVTSELLLYGKQTDRAPRLEWVVAKTDLFASDEQFLTSTFAGMITGQPTVTPIGSLSVVADALTWNWHLPQEVTHKQHAELVKQKFRQVLGGKWANIPFASLENKTPHEAAQIPDLRIPLQALLVGLEQSPHGQTDDGAAVNALREELGLQPLGFVELADIKGRSVSPLEQQYLKIEKLSDPELVEILSEAMTIGNMRVLRRAAPEVIARPQIENPTRDVVYSLLAQLTDDEEQSLQYLAHARSEAKNLNRPIGVYLVQEFEFRIARGMTEKLPALLQTIQTHHLKDPEVEYHLSRVLQRYGLLRGRADADLPQAAESMPTGARPEVATWGNTVDGGLAAGPTAGGEEEAAKEPSKLWVPD